MKDKTEKTLKKNTKAKLKEPMEQQVPLHFEDLSELDSAWAQRAELAELVGAHNGSNVIYGYSTDEE